MPLKGRPVGSKNSYPSDTQRERLYDAERELVDFMHVDFASLKDTERFVKRFVQRKAWTDRSHINKVHVTSNNRIFATGYACGSTGEIDLPAWAWTKMIIAHELAHCMTPPQKDRAKHGREFAGTYLYLVGKICDHNVKEQLKRAFFRNNVDWDSNYAN